MARLVDELRARPSPSGKGVEVNVDVITRTRSARVVALQRRCCGSGRFCRERNAQNTIRVWKRMNLAHLRTFVTMRGA